MYTYVLRENIKDKGVGGGGGGARKERKLGRKGDIFTGCFVLKNFAFKISRRQWTNNLVATLEAYY